MPRQTTKQTTEQTEAQQPQRTELSIVSDPQSNSLSVRELTPDIWQMINQMAPVMYKSRLFGVTSSEAAGAIMLKGYEMGLSITASFELIQVIQGKPGLSPRGAMALLLNSPKIKTIKVEKIVKDGKFVGFSCYMERVNGFGYTATFTLDDAKKADLVKPGSGWEKYPENMCQWRAIGFAADVVAPDITSGMTNIMKMPEQYGVALTEGGDVIEATATTVIDAQPVQSVPTSQSNITLEMLVDLYGAEAIMIANEGKIPADQAEVNEVASKLAGVTA